jgi:inorganic pyrophosphatase
MQRLDRSQRLGPRSVRRTPGAQPSVWRSRRGWLPSRRSGLSAIPALDDDGAMHVVVESPRGSTSKLKYDPELGAMTLSRLLPHGLAYPHDWGFVPSTRAPDGDPLDAMIVWDGVSTPGLVVTCRAIGVLLVEQTNKETGRRERNDRLAVLPVDAPRWETVQTIDDLGPRVRDELTHFFEAAVEFEGKNLKILGWRGPAEAMRLLEQSMRPARKTRTPRRR